MTLNELKNSVVDLGFEVGLDKEEMLIPALSRALYTIYHDRPRLRTVRLGIRSVHGSLVSEHISHIGGERISYKLDGVAYSFRASGRGRYIIDYGSGTEEHAFDCDMGEMRGMLRSAATITFLGEYSYDIYSLAVLHSVEGPNTASIPIYGEDRCYDLRALYPDILTPHSLPRTRDGATIGGSLIRDGIMYIPWGFSGEVQLTYRRAPYVATGDDMDEAIDISREVEELLPLLVASYLWLDDDSDKAQYYMSLYHRGMATVQATASTELGRAYTTNGWA